MRTSTLVIAVTSALTFAALGYVVYYVRNSLPSVPSVNDFEGKLKELDANLKRTTGEIEELQGNSECEFDSDCHVMGLGAKTCGGFLNFLIYSSRDVVDETKLREAVRRYNDLSDEKNRLSYKVLSCGQTPSQIRCIEKRCVPDAHGN